MGKYDSPAIFASYKSDDVEFVRPICERLMAEGYAPWLNEYGVPFDLVDDFQRFINRAVDAADWGLLFASDRYTLSPYCNIEVERLLRRLPANKLLVFRPAEPTFFEDVYPELRDRQLVAHSESDVFGHLAAAGVIAAPLSPRALPGLPDAPSWLLKDIGARFDPQPWQVEVGSVMRHAGRPQWVDVTGEQRADLHQFVARIDNREVRLWVDYRMLEQEFRGSIERRTAESDDGTLRFLEDDEDDRRRLKEELRYFAREVETMRSTMMPGADGGATGSAGQPEFEAIGVHMFNTIEKTGGSRNAYKHRLFSFRLSGRIYRVYKLALPQPQLRVPVALRFVFEFDDDLRAFFSALPLCDRLVRSLSWINLATNPGLDRTGLREAMDRLGGSRCQTP